MSDNNKFFSFFKKKEDKKFIFDESYFDLKITGGKLQSELITIEGVAAQGIVNINGQVGIRWTYSAFGFIFRIATTLLNWTLWAIHINQAPMTLDVDSWSKPLQYLKVGTMKECPNQWRLDQFTWTQQYRRKLMGSWRMRR